MDVRRLDGDGWNLRGGDRPVFSSILNSRFVSRVTACQDNLRQVGTSLVQYSEYLGDGFFPAVPIEGIEPVLESGAHSD